MIIILTVILTAGQFLFAFAAATLNTNLMLLARFVYGIGGESVGVALLVLIGKWFRGKEMSVAFGVNLCCARLGSVVNDVVSGIIAAQTSVPAALTAGGIFVAFGLNCALVLAFVDWKYQSELEEVEENGEAHHEDGERAKKSSFDLQFGKLFWLLVILGVFAYCSVMPFMNIFQGFMISKWLSGQSHNSAEKIAGLMLGVTYTVSAITAPFLGVLIDRAGRRVNLMVAGSVLVLISHLMLITIYPLLPLIILGFGFSFFVASWMPSTSYVVAPHKLGLAYGVISSCTNLGMTFIPIVVGLLMSPSSDYTLIHTLFLALSGLSIMLTLLVLKENRQNGNVLNLPSLQAEEMSKLLLSSENGKLRKQSFKGKEQRGLFDIDEEDEETSLLHDCQEPDEEISPSDD